ncbi:peptidase inhibitor family I36 protein [Streptomyces sp. NPDC088246]|uniref:peptidase inhibitor family I36 protein n=1 Tax=Streptomyces sp. NPDC088246 TaxID=3365842 RepID=UPI00381EE0CC
MFGTDRRAVVPVGFVALLPAALVPLTAERADAAPTADNCPQGMVCFYPQADCQESVQIADLAATPGCRSTIPARSVINNSSSPVGLYVDDECTRYPDRVEACGTRDTLAASAVTADRLMKQGQVTGCARPLRDSAVPPGTTLDDLAGPCDA